MGAVMRVLAWMGIIVAVGWCYFAPGFEPVTVLIGSVIVLAGMYLREPKRSGASLRQRQAVSGGSVGVQAGRDATYRNQDPR